MGSYAGWDRFGRVSRQAWVDGASGPGSGGLPNRPPVLETAYGYDRASNRLFARDVRPGAKLPDRDWQYEYDGLDRLKEAERGVWNGSTLVTGVGGQRWDLDMLGNWTAFRRDLAGNGLYSSVETRDHNAANEITALDPDGGGGAPQLPFAYDDAGNMRTRDRSPTAQTVYTHDAWNRLVKVTIDQMNPAGSITLQESEYNGLHWRTVRRLDTTTPANGLDQMRVMHYSASWQVLQEDIDDGYTGTYSPDRRAQQFWGLRYIDDAIARRSKATLAGSYALPWFYVTDAQFSVAAVLNASGKLVERVRYDPYGTASHHWAGDVDGDGDEDKDDENLVTASYGSIGSTAYNADADINRDGVVDAADLALVGKNAALAKGMISDPSGPDNAVGYCGYLFSRETALYAVRFRHYDAGLGRWLERDPVGHRVLGLTGKVARTFSYYDGMNLFQYTKGAPGRGSDPSGLLGPDMSAGDELGQKVFQPSGCCGGKRFNTNTHCCEDGAVVEKVGAYVINRGGPRQRGSAVPVINVPGPDWTGGHIDMAVSGCGMFGFYGAGAGSGLPGMGLEGYFLHHPEEWLRPITQGGRPMYAVGPGNEVTYLDSGQTVAYEGVLSTICEIKVCPSQAKSMCESLAKHKMEPGKFNILGRNCSTMACEILGAGGVGTGHIGGIDSPLALMEDLERGGAKCFSGYTSIDLRNNVTITPVGAK